MINICLRQLVDRLSDSADRENPPCGEDKRDAVRWWHVPTTQASIALEVFHNHIPLGCLDDFEIEYVEVGDEAEALGTRLECWATVSLVALREENERLKSGRFSPDELQQLCHHLSEQPAQRDAFLQGCGDYQRKLFGTDQREQLFLAALAALNAAVAADPTAMRAKLINVVPVNEALANHPTVIVQSDPPGAEELSQVKGYLLTTLGLINGVLAAMEMPTIAAVFDDETGRLQKFQVYEFDDENEEVTKIEIVELPPEQTTPPSLIERLEKFGTQLAKDEGVRHCSSLFNVAGRTDLEIADLITRYSADPHVAHVDRVGQYLRVVYRGY